MKGVPYKKEHYGRQVWVSPILDEARKEEGLCYSCAKFSTNESENCLVARNLFEICKREGITTPVASCPEFEQLSAPEDEWHH